MSSLPLPVELPYAVQLERALARARLVAALVTGPAGVLLLLASAGRVVVGVLGLLCVLAAIGWVFAARRGLRRARERGSWRLRLSDGDLTATTEQGDIVVARASIEAVSFDEDTLQVVIVRIGADELRLDATWGQLGAVDLHTLLLRWWGRSRAHAPPG